VLVDGKSGQVFLVGAGYPVLTFGTTIGQMIYYRNNLQEEEQNNL
jgi:hypothetical protein